MKPCRTCKSKPIKNGIYLAKIQHFFEKSLPKTNKLYHEKSLNTYKIEMKGLKPNKKIFYFGTQSRDFTKPIQNFMTAYSNLKNSGVTKSDRNGKATFYLQCPQVYRNENGKVYSRHFHFMYWNNKKNKWNKNVYTHQIFCDVHQTFVNKHLNNKNVIIIDALPSKFHNKKHIYGSINIPYTKKITSKMVIDEIKKKNKKYNGNKLIPIIVYCWSSKCNAAEKLNEKLNKLGFYNTVHYVDGISKWKGKTSSNLK